MPLATEIVRGDYAPECAARIGAAIPARGAVVLTGGTTAEPIYRHLANLEADWRALEVFFSDERCVPPDDPASNYGMAHRTLLDHVVVGAEHRMEGEIDPEHAATRYDRAVGDSAPAGFDLVLLGMGADCHICALFPGSSALGTTSSLCAVVDRPDGMTGLTLTPPALLNAKKILLIVAGEDKAEAVARAVGGNDEPASCPARLLADHPDATFLLDPAAASAL